MAGLIFLILSKQGFDYTMASIMGIYWNGLFVNIIACLADGKFLVELSCPFGTYMIKKTLKKKQN